MSTYWSEDGCDFTFEKWFLLGVFEYARFTFKFIYLCSAVDSCGLMMMMTFKFVKSKPCLFKKVLSKCS